MPMQGPQALSRMRAPAATMVASAPLFASMVSTWREPGAMTRLTCSATVFPLRMSATFIMSAKEELVQLPMAT